jgi:hypothetical protein
VRQHCSYCRLYAVLALPAGRRFRQNLVTCLYATTQTAPWLSIAICREKQFLFDFISVSCRAQQ